MKKFIWLSLLSLTLSASTYADSFIYQENPVDLANNLYVNVFGGANFLKFKHIAKNELRAGYMLSASFGYRFSYGIRIEAECAYRRNSIKQYYSTYQKTYNYFETTSYMANVLWDLPVSRFCHNIQPFVGGGMGYDRLGLEHRQQHSKFITTITKSQYAWQVITGFGYPLFCNADVSFAYTLHKGNLQERSNHTFGFGLTYNFGEPTFI